MLESISSEYQRIFIVIVMKKTKNYTKMVE